jgi:putative transposase
MVLAENGVMARPWRIQYEGAVYHVISRGNERQDIFLEDRDRLDFLGLLARASGGFDLRIMAFCLMSNHYHLFLRTMAPNLAAAMQWLNTTYTTRFHLYHQRSGHLLQGRYKSVLILDEAHWHRLSFYIHLNPVRAGLVADPIEYEWSSYREFVQARSRFPWLQPGELLAAFGSDDATRRRGYRRQALSFAGQPETIWREFREAPILGPEEAVQEVIATHRPRGKTEAVPDFRRQARKKAEIKIELARVAEAFGVKPEDILRRRRDFPPRRAAYFYLVEIRGVKVTEVAQAFGLSTTAVSMGVTNFRRLLAKDRRLRTTFGSLMGSELQLEVRE